MKKYSYLVLGRGVGWAIVRDLAMQKNTKLVAILDRDKSILRLGRELSKVSSVRCDYIVADIESINLESLFKLFDVVISALPAKFSPMLAKAAIKSRVGFCELGGVVSVTQDCLDLDRYAKNAGVSVVLDSGLQPGLGMILARKLLEEHPTIKELGIFVGGMPQKPKPPVNHQNMYAIGGMRHLCYDKVPILENNEIVYKEPLSDYEQIRIDALRKYSKKFNGHVEAFLTAGASIAPWTFKTLGVKIFEKTLRWPGFIKFVKDIPEDKFEETILPHISVPVDKENPDLVFMRVVGKDKNGETLGCYELLDKFDPITGLSAMQRTTGFTTALIARWIAQKKIFMGVNTPEFAIPVRDLGVFIEEIGQYFNN